MRMKQLIFLMVGFSASAMVFAAPVTVAEIDAARYGGLQQAWITSDGYASGINRVAQVVYEGWVRGCDTNTSSIFTTQAGGGGS